MAAPFLPHPIRCIPGPWDELPIQSDTIIKISDSIYRLHSSVIAASSAYFFNHFHNPFYNKIVKYEIDLYFLPGRNTSFELIAKLMYDKKVQLNNFNLIPVYCASRFLKISDFMALCYSLIEKDMLSNWEISSEALCQIYIDKTMVNIEDVVLNLQKVIVGYAKKFEVQPKPENVFEARYFFLNLVKTPELVLRDLLIKFEKDQINFINVGNLIIANQSDWFLDWEACVSGSNYNDLMGLVKVESIEIFLNYLSSKIFSNRNQERVRNSPSTQYVFALMNAFGRFANMKTGFKNLFQVSNNLYFDLQNVNSALKNDLETKGKKLSSFDNERNQLHCTITNLKSKLVELETFREVTRGEKNLVKMFQAHPSRIHTILVSKHGTIWTTGYDDMIICGWQNERRVFRMRGHTTPVNALVGGKDGSLWSGSTDGTLRHWKEGRCMAILEGGLCDSIFAMVTSSDGCLWTGGRGNYRIKKWNAYANVLSLSGHTGAIFTLVIALNGCLVSGGEDAILRMWDTTTGICFSTVHVGACVYRRFRFRRMITCG